MEMVLGVMEGQIRGGYFLDFILDSSLDPSVVDRSPRPCGGLKGDRCDGECL